MTGAQRETFRIPDQECWHCGLMLGGAVGLDGANPPDRGDVSLCVHCGALTVFDRCDAGHLLRRPPTSRERGVFEDDEPLMRRQAKLRSMFDSRRKARWN
jgi:hypothetical protein